MRRDNIALTATTAPSTRVKRRCTGGELDVLALVLVQRRNPVKLAALHVEMAADGLPAPVSTVKPNAEVALDVDVTTSMSDFVELLVH